MGIGLRHILSAALGLAVAGGLAAQTQPTQSVEPLVITSNQPRTVSEAVDRIIAREHQASTTRAILFTTCRGSGVRWRPSAQLPKHGWSPYRRAHSD